MEAEKKRICVLLDSGKKMGVLGYNYHATLGINLEVDTDKPVQYTVVDLPIKMDTIVMGAECTMCIASDGTVWAWGNLPGKDSLTLAPTLLELPGKYVALGVGNGFACFINANGGVETIGEFPGCNKPLPECFPPMVAVACADSHIVLVDVSGVLWTSGLGSGETREHRFYKHTYFELSAGQPMEEVPKISQIACGDYHTLVLDYRGKMFSFGIEGNGQLGISWGGSQYHPRFVPSTLEFDSIWCCSSTSYASQPCGEVSVFGWFSTEGLPGGTQTDYLCPTQLPILTGKTVIPGRNLVAYADDTGVSVWDTPEFPGFRHSYVCV